MLSKHEYNSFRHTGLKWGFWTANCGPNARTCSDTGLLSATNNILGADGLMSQQKTWTVSSRVLTEILRMGHKCRQRSQLSQLGCIPESFPDETWRLCHALNHGRNKGRGVGGVCPGKHVFSPSLGWAPLVIPLLHWGWTTFMNLGHRKATNSRIAWGSESSSYATATNKQISLSRQPQSLLSGIQRHTFSKFCVIISQHSLPYLCMLSMCLRSSS